VFYDFNKPEDLPAELLHTFDLVVIDPPFITREVWEKYAVAAKLLLKEEGGHCLLSTIDENEATIKELLGADRKKFRPSIPNLVYQYSLYATFESTGLNEKNPEIPDFD
jgi:16S rRNA G966 N2-methylase RsmD